MTDLLEAAAKAVTAANEYRTAGWVDEATAHEEWSADRLSWHNAVTPTEAPDADLPADEPITESVEQDTDDLPADPDAAWDEGGEG